MKMKSFLIPVLTLVLAGCANEELETLGGGGGSSPGVSSGQTVLFSNNTAVTIGDASEVQIRAVAVTGQVNDACSLEMGESPDAGRGDVTIRSGSSEIYNKWNGNVNKRIFVEGTLVLQDGYKSGNESVYIKEGGKLVLETENLKNISVFNYGGEIEVKTTELNVDGATLKTENDLDIEGNVTMKNGTVYVGGDFTCAGVVAENNSHIHVLGDLNLTESDGVSEFGGNVNTAACIEGTLQAATFNLNNGAKLHVGCKLVADKALNLSGNNSKITAEYIKSAKTTITGGNVTLKEGGLADLGDLYTESNAGTFSVMGTGKAMIACSTCTLTDTDNLKDAIGPDFYFNYEKAYVEGTEKEIEIGTELVNVATPNDYVEGGCNPGFTPDEVDPEPEPEPEPEPDPEPGISDDIELQIPTDIEREWFAEADDFAIRVNGRYEEEIILEGNATTLHGVKISESNLKVTLSGIENLPSGDEYTYELWVWVEEESWNAFTDAERKAWVSGDGDGTDITEKCTITAPEGYSVRKNVYAGLGGQKDTPYIKISIHVVRD